MAKDEDKAPQQRDVIPPKGEKSYTEKVPRPEKDGNAGGGASDDQKK